MKRASPGDAGLCPRCGLEMKEKEYDSHDLSGIPGKVSGRYWHMVNEHGIYEHYHMFGYPVAVNDAKDT